MISPPMTDPKAEYGDGNRRTALVSGGSRRLSAGGGGAATRSDGQQLGHGGGISVLDAILHIQHTELGNFRQLIVNLTQLVAMPDDHTFQHWEAHLINSPLLNIQVLQQQKFQLLEFLVTS
ncbi:DNA-directed RNA polymerase subunit beta' [Striga asiatica]|uniref:DNA-directed RNA polymerase subunit beta n=1 Tax=Striga asiatica TaxID=4170 RepID=A0A5A7RI06_STRAF|nr:DNA-directed RNA polymerase subunit beta' [Striga asiatica]